MSNALVFDFDGEPVRSAVVAGSVYLVARDVCRCLGIENNRDAVARLPADERREINLNTVGTTDTPSRGNPNAIAISEAGVYRLIFESRKPQAERFKTWVFNEVLPAIRKTGSFGTPHLDVKTQNAALALVRQAQRTFGRGMAQAIWIDIGLPNPEPLFEDQPKGRRRPSADKAGKPALAEPPDDICRFLAEGCVMTTDSLDRLSSPELFAGYLSFCRFADLAPLPSSVFHRRVGRLARVGWLDGAGKLRHLRRLKSNGRVYSNLRLSPHIRAT